MTDKRLKARFLVNTVKVLVNDVQLNVCDMGQGPPLLLVHGFPLDHSMWQGQIESFRDSCRVIAPDLRGFGQSDVTTGTVGMDQLADDLAALLDVLQVEQPVVFCGLSMGGYVAWQFVQRHRSRLQRLIVCDTRAIADPPEVAQGRLQTAQQVLREGAEVVATAMIEKLFSPATRQKRPDVVQQTRQVMCKTHPQAVAAALRGMAARPDVTHELDRIDCPTLVVCGQYDEISTVQEMRDLADKIPASTFVEISDAGHMAPLEDPLQVNRAIRNFWEA